MGNKHSAPSPQTRLDCTSQGADLQELARLDPHSYTGGRWLNRDELERNSRHVMFDFSALCKRAIHICPGATRIVNCEKREGGFN
ncbi:hypothetical protein N7541_010508 [Penicillium brevicompactum]|uniref:Uncharacterized protein n=1 Tax=Penicillium brevicompactum TaxID=5074 RepID=A0A9W9QRP8_PENBR|nr:hypothetical protein N7541_010508 [Penicillium brevicompactum]